MHQIMTLTSFLPLPSASEVCPPCDSELKADTILDHFCASDFGKRLTVTQTTQFMYLVTYHDISKPYFTLKNVI